MEHTDLDQSAMDNMPARDRLYARDRMYARNMTHADNKAPTKEKVSSKDRLAKLFWGQMIDVDLSERIVALVFTMVAIASLSFCQLAFIHVTDIGGVPIYAFLTIAPLLMGALMFGPVTGLLLGLYSGAVLFAHANLFPLDFYEVHYFTIPANTFVLFTLLGGLGGLAFSFITKRKLSTAAKSVLICLVCLLLSALMSTTLINIAIAVYGEMYGYPIEVLHAYLFVSEIGVAIQIIDDAVVAAVLCLIANTVVSRVIHRSRKRKLSAIFQNWMMLVSAIVFMVASSAIFTYATITNLQSANEVMVGESEYLASQLHASEDEGTLAVNPQRLLEGYDVEIDGQVVITDMAGTILATDDPERWPVGGSYSQITEYINEDFEGYPEIEGVSPNTCYVLEYESTLNRIDTLQLPGANGQMQTAPLYVAVAKHSTGYVAMMWDSDIVFATRSGIMTAATILAALLIVAIGVLANVLLRKMVVRHIDDTNSSLEKITYGDLNVRVDTQDTVEFDSLSTGINSTVMALKNTIDEVEHKNAQDLATAKAIQEDAIPTEFPAFPNIDKFDIYASMKTAKEVGGDFYDFFEIERTTKIGFFLADVSGKGIPAALFMMASKTQLRNHLEAGLTVDEAVNASNHQLCMGNDAGMFVTALVAVLDYETGHVEYVNAGHNPPLLLHDGKWEWLKDVSGMPLGLFDGIPYDKLELDLAKGDTLYFYTDGVTEAMDVEGNLFGEDRLEETLVHYAGMNPRSIGVGVRRSLTDFTQDAEQSDDITMLALKYGVPPEEKAVMVLDAKRDQLVHVVNYIHAELYRRRAPKTVYGQLDIACEELFTNVCMYAYPDATEENPGVARIEFEYAPNPPTLTVQIADDGVPYNPLEKEDAVTVDDYDGIEEVPIGGLGIMLAKQNVDEMAYDRVNGTSNVLTFKKSW